MKQFLLTLCVIGITQTLTLAQHSTAPKNGIGLRMGTQGTYLMYTRELKNDYSFRTKLSLANDPFFSIGIQKDLVKSEKLNLYHGLEIGINQYWEYDNNRFDRNYAISGNYLFGVEYNPSKRFTLFAESNVLSYSKTNDAYYYWQVPAEYKLKIFDHVQVGAKFNF